MKKRVALITGSTSGISLGIAKASDNAATITGVALPLDGGWLAQ